MKKIKKPQTIEQKLRAKIRELQKDLERREAWITEFQTKHAELEALYHNTLEYKLTSALNDIECLEIAAKEVEQQREDEEDENREHRRLYGKCEACEDYE